MLLCPEMEGTKDIWVACSQDLLHRVSFALFLTMKDLNVFISQGGWINREGKAYDLGK